MAENEPTVVLGGVTTTEAAGEADRRRIGRHRPLNRLGARRRFDAGDVVGADRTTGCTDAAASRREIDQLRTAL